MKKIYRTKANPQSATQASEKDRFYDHLALRDGRCVTPPPHASHGQSEPHVALSDTTHIVGQRSTRERHRVSGGK